MPESRFAPARFQARRRSLPRIRAAIAVVVVFPFVAETSATPSGSRAARASTAPGSAFQRSFPGSVVPPPRPAARDSAPDRACGHGLEPEAHAHRASVAERSARRTSALDTCEIRQDDLSCLQPWRLRAIASLRARESTRPNSPRSEPGSGAGTRTTRSSTSSAPPPNASAAPPRCGSSRPTTRRASTRRRSSSTSARGTRPSARRGSIRVAFSRATSCSSSYAGSGESSAGRRPRAISQHAGARCRRCRCTRTRSDRSATHFGKPGSRCCGGGEARARDRPGRRARATSRPSAADGGLGGRAARGSRAPLRVAGLPAARRPAGRVDGVPVPRPRKAARAARRGRSRRDAENLS